LLKKKGYEVIIIVDVGNKMINKKSLRELILSEDVNGLDRYGQYDKSQGDPKGADDLMKLLNDFIPLVEKALAKAGPFVASVVLEDFQNDMKERLKTVKLPSTSNLSNIMSDIEKKEEEFKQQDLAKDAAKAVPEEKPAAAPAAGKPAKKPIKVP
jgi:hypothetical protein